ncbi:uncharacterized protein [Panulirus ornatus]
MQTMFLAGHLPWLLLSIAAMVSRSGVNQSAAEVVRPDVPTTTAWASFTTEDVLIVAEDHENATVAFVIRGEVSECVNITFTYDHEKPTIQPVEGFSVCPHHPTPHALSTTQPDQVPPGGGDEGRPRGQHLPSIASRPLAPLHISLLAGRRTQGVEVSTQHPPPVIVNVSLDIVSCSVGKTILIAEADSPVVDVADAFVRVSVIHNTALEVASNVMGWMYTIAWDVSFLPQVILNWKRKSVVGFSLDNVCLNILAYFYYMLFNVAFYAIPLIKDQFRQRYPRSVNHVRLNDVVFASYATVMILFEGVQCCMYERGPGQTVSRLCRMLLLVFVLVVVVSCVLVGAGIIWWLDVFYIMSYLKLIITPIKYTPQVYVNYKRKSTVGFSVSGVTLDLLGSILSLVQMFLLAANSDDWVSLFTDFAKFGLAIVGIFFAAVYIAQQYHYSLR